MRICILPRWSASTDDAWYPWLGRRLSRRGHEVLVVPLRPSATAPLPAASVAELSRRLGCDPGELADTILVGHSVGCQVALRFLASLPAGALRLAGVLAVAGWWSLDQPSPALRPWLEPPAGLAPARAAARFWKVLLSDNDPATADHRTNRQQWIERLGAEVAVIRGAGHFNRSREPAVEQALLAALP